MSSRSSMQNVKKLADEIKRHKNFKRLAAWATDALAEVAAPPASGWQRKIKAAVRYGTIPALVHVLGKFGDDSNLARQCLRLLQAACFTANARDVAAASAATVSKHVVTVAGAPGAEGPPLDEDIVAGLAPAASILRTCMTEFPEADYITAAASACFAILLPDSPEASKSIRGASADAVAALRTCAEATEASAETVAAALPDGSASRIAALGEAQEESAFAAALSSAAAGLLRRIAGTPDGLSKIKSDPRIEAVLLGRIDSQAMQGLPAQGHLADVLRGVIQEDLTTALAAGTALSADDVRKIGAAALSPGWADQLSDPTELFEQLVLMAQGGAGVAGGLQMLALVAVGRISQAAGPAVRDILAGQGASSAALAVASPAAAAGDEPEASDLQKAAYGTLGRLLAHPQGIVRLGMAQVKEARGSSSGNVEVRGVQVELFKRLLPAWAASDGPSLLAATSIISSAQAGMLDDDVLAEAGLLEFVGQAAGPDGAAAILPPLVSAQLLTAAAAVLGTASTEQAVGFASGPSPMLAQSILLAVADSASKNKKAKKSQMTSQAAANLAIPAAVGPAAATAATALLASLYIRCPPRDEEAARMACEDSLAAALRAFRSVRQSDALRHVFAQLTQACVRSDSISARVMAVAVLARTLRAAQGDETLFRSADGCLAALGVDTKKAPGSVEEDRSVAAGFLASVDMGLPKAVAAAAVQQLSVLEASVALPGFFEQALGEGGAAVLATAAVNLLRMHEIVGGSGEAADGRTRLSPAVTREAAVRALRVVDKLLRVASPAIGAQQEQVAEARAKGAASGGGGAPARPRKQLAKLLRSAASMAVMTRGLQETVRDKNARRQQIRGAMEREAVREASQQAVTTGAEDVLEDAMAGGSSKDDKAALAAATKRIDAVVLQLARRLKTGAQPASGEGVRRVDSLSKAEVQHLHETGRRLIDSVLATAGTSLIPAVASRRRSGTVGAGAGAASGAGATDEQRTMAEAAEEAGTSIATIRWGPEIVAAAAELLVDCTAAARDLSDKESSASLAVEAHLLTGLLADGRPPAASYRYVSACLGTMATPKGLAALAELEDTSVQRAVASISALLSGLVDAATRSTGRSADAAHAISSVGLFLHASSQQLPAFADALRSDGTMTEVLDAAGALAKAVIKALPCAPVTAIGNERSKAILVAARSSVRRALGAAITDEAVARWCSEVEAKAAEIVKAEEASSAPVVGDAEADSTSGPSVATDAAIVSAQSAAYKITALLHSYRGVIKEMPGQEASLQSLAEVIRAIERAGPAGGQLMSLLAALEERTAEIARRTAPVGGAPDAPVSFTGSVPDDKIEGAGQETTPTSPTLSARAFSGLSRTSMILALSRSMHKGKGGKSSVGSFRQASMEGGLKVPSTLTAESADPSASSEGGAPASPAPPEASGDLEAVCEEAEDDEDERSDSDDEPPAEEDKEEGISLEPASGAGADLPTPVKPEAALAAAAAESPAKSDEDTSGLRADTFFRATLGNDFQPVDDVDFSDDETAEDGKSSAARTAYDTSFHGGSTATMATEGAASSSSEARLKKVHTLVPARQGAKRKDAIGYRADRLRQTQQKLDRIDRSRELKLEDAADDKYKWSLYPQLRTPESFTRHMFMGASRAREYQFQWQPNDLVRSLVYFKDRKVEANAKKAFACLLRYAGEVAPDPGVSRPAHAKEVMRIGLAHPVLVNEIYLQLMKQLTHNESVGSRAKYWSLLSMAAGTFPPGQDLLPYVHHFLGQAVRSSHHIALHAHFCMRLLDLVGEQGPTGYVPGEAEIESYDARLPLMVNVQLPAGDHLLVDIPAAPDLTVEQLAQICAQTAGLPEQRSDSLVLYVETLPEGADVIIAPEETTGFMPLPAEAETRRLMATDGFVGDELGILVRQNRPFRVVFGRWLPLDLEVDDIREDMLLHVLFEEALLQLSRGGMPETDEVRAVELAALAMAVDHGRDLMTDKKSVERLGVQQYVAPPVRAGRTSEEWAGLVSTVLAGKHDPRRKPLAAIRAAFLHRTQEHLLSSTAQIVAEPVPPKDIVFGSKMPPRVRLGFGMGGVVILDAEMHEVLAGFDLPDVESWSVAEGYLQLDVIETTLSEAESGEEEEAAERRIVRFRTKQARVAQDFLVSYVNLTIQLQAAETEL